MPEQQELFSSSNLYDRPAYVPKVDRVAIYTFANITAASLVHPLDYIKTRVQTTSYPYTPTQIAMRIYRLEGPITFTYGMRASQLRQLLLSSVRVGTYVYLFDRYRNTHNIKPDLRMRIKLGIVAGMAGAFVSNPAEVILIRTMAASAPRAYNNCPDLQSLINNRYKGVVDAFIRIFREEGVKGLWRGGMLVQARSILFSIVSIGGYTSIADTLKKWNMREGYLLHTVTSLLTTMVLTFTTLPLDIIKTRYQMRRDNLTQRALLKRIVELRGLFFIKRPLVPFYIRQALHNLLSFFIAEEIEYLYQGESMVMKRVRKEIQWFRRRDEKS